MSGLLSKLQARQASGRTDSQHSSAEMCRGHGGIPRRFAATAAAHTSGLAGLPVRAVRALDVTILAVLCLRLASCASCAAHWQRAQQLGKITLSRAAGTGATEDERQRRRGRGHTVLAGRAARLARFGARR